MTNALDTLNLWLDYCKFDPTKNSFNLLSMEYDIHSINKTIIKIVDQYDDTGVLALIYAKIMAERIFKKATVNVFDIINNKETFDIERKLWEQFHAPEIITAEQKFIDVILNITQQIIKTPLLGDVNNEQIKQNFFQSMEAVLKNLSHLREDLYLKGAEIKPIESFSTHIHVFDTLANCLTALEHTADGIYLCYVSNFNSSDGYFGYYIKNNGNIFSLNERIDETYPGQHHNCRNNRWAENKQYELFPYDYIFSFEQHDYKGYASKHIIDHDKLDFVKLDQSLMFNIVLSMILINHKYIGKTFSDDTKVKFVNSLFPINVKVLENTQDQNALVLYNNSNIVLAHKQCNFTFDNDKIINGSYDKMFDNSNSDRLSNECGVFNGFNQIMIDTFGQDFKYDPNTLMMTDYSQKLISNQTISDDQSIESEFVGSKERLQFQAYYNVRKQLAKHIKQKQLKSYEDFGGQKQLSQWWNEHLEQRIQYIYQLCVDADLNDNTSFVYTRDNGYHKDNIKCIQIFKDVKYPSGVFVRNYLNEYDFRGSKIYCRITNNACSHFFVFRPSNWLMLEQIIDCDVPDFIKGWYDDHTGYPYSGNPILNAVDPVSMLQTPVNRRGNGDNPQLTFSFDFVIGFSKNGYKKILKQYSNKKGIK